MSILLSDCPSNLVPISIVVGVVAMMLMVLLKVVVMVVTMTVRAFLVISYVHKLSASLPSGVEPHPYFNFSIIAGLHILLTRENMNKAVIDKFQAKFFGQSIIKYTKRTN